MSYSSILVPLVTPLDDDGRVCEESVARLIESIHPFVRGYIPCLTSGEGWALTHDQWKAMILATLRHAGNRDVIAGIEKPTTNEVLELAREANRLGVDAIMVTTPFGASVTQEEMIAHYRHLHDETALHLNIYNESALSRNHCELDSLLAIAALPRVIGIKDSSDEPRTDAVIGQFQNHGVAYFHGWENRMTGQPIADGNVVSLSNLEPAICGRACMINDTGLQEIIDEHCARYRLQSDDWYRHVKLELHERGIIASARTVES